MSLGDSHVPEEKAIESAEETLRLEIGNLPHLGAPEIKEGVYVFPLLISIPRVIFDKEGEEPVGVRFLDETKIGEIHVDTSTGEVVDRTDLRTIENKIEEKEKEIEREVQRALIRSSAEEFSQLPYSTHRYTPVRNVLSDLILTEELPKANLKTMGLYEKYLDHLDILLDSNLVREENGSYVAGDVLTQILSDSNVQPSDALKEAMKYLFKKYADDLEMMHEILGPHLEVAGYYYRRAIQSEKLPSVSKSEIGKMLESREHGKKAKRKGFQASRYLLQLEEVGLLESEAEHGNRVWAGDKTIRKEILEQDQSGSLTQISAI